jgi:hypothetical protein
MGQKGGNADARLRCEGDGVMMGGGWLIDAEVEKGKKGKHGQQKAEEGPAEEGGGRGKRPGGGGGGPIRWAWRGTYWKTLAWGNLMMVMCLLILGVLKGPQLDSIQWLHLHNFFSVRKSPENTA